MHSIVPILLVTAALLLGLFLALGVARVLRKCASTDVDASELE